MLVLSGMYGWMLRRRMGGRLHRPHQRHLLRSNRSYDRRHPTSFFSGSRNDHRGQGCNRSRHGRYVPEASSQLLRTLLTLPIEALVGITPVLVSEISKSDHRGAFLGYVFIANYLGISLAYWMDFGLAFLDGGRSPIRWRFLLAFQCFPALILLLGVKTLPDSPRFLASVGRNKEAREVLVCLRGTDNDQTEREYNEIVSMAENSTKSSPIEFFKVILGLDVQKAPHLGRRAWLAIFLQIMASWTGITAVTAYSPVLLRQAGYSQLTQNGLAGGLNTVGIVGTIISAQIVDKLGRRTCLMSGAAGLFAVNLVVSTQLPLSFGLVFQYS